jgi:translation initiation factor 1 (eIF-1/SUI1)
MDHASLLIRKGDKSGLLKLLDESGTLNIIERDKKGRTILHLAVELGKYDIVKDLLNRSEVLFFLECKGGKKKWRSPMEVAASMGNIKMIKAIIWANYNIKGWDKFEDVCLNVLEKYDHPIIQKEIVKFLKSSALKRMYYSEFAQDIEKFKEKCESMYWWNDKWLDGEWNIEDRQSILEIVVNLGIQGYVESIRYFLEKTKVYLEKRRGAFVTIIKNLPLESEEAKEFTSQLKKSLATGGSFKENLVEIQGDHLEKVKLFLKSKGFI